MTRFDETRGDFEPYGLYCKRWTPTLMSRPDRHNEIELNLLEQGSVTYRMWGRKIIVQPNQLTAFWAAIPHQIIDFSGVDSYWVATFPLAWLTTWQCPKSFVDGLVNGSVMREKRHDRLETELFTLWAQDLDSNIPYQRENVALELQARVRRMALNLVNPVNRTQTDSKTEFMAGFIAQHYLEDIRVDNVAQCVGLNPDYANTLFKQTYGTTVLQFILDHRVQHAQRLLVTTQERVLDVAAMSGFSSLSRFNTVFKTHCGLTPRAYRNAMTTSA